MALKPQLHDCLCFSVLWGSCTYRIKFVFLLFICLLSIIRPAKEPRRAEGKSSLPYKRKFTDKLTQFKQLIEIELFKRKSPRPHLCYCPGMTTSRYLMNMWGLAQGGSRNEGGKRRPGTKHQAPQLSCHQSSTRFICGIYCSFCLRPT